MSLNTYVQSPSALLDYTMRYGSWLKTGETIAQSTWAASPSGGLTISGQAVVSGDAVAWVQAPATTGGTFTLTNSISTSGGRTDSRSVTITIAQR